MCYKEKGERKEEEEEEGKPEASCKSRSFIDPSLPPETQSVSLVQWRKAVRSLAAGIWDNFKEMNCH